MANLGEIRLAVQEANGDLSVYRRDAPRAGLPIVPPEELTGVLDREDIAPLGERNGERACLRCGAAGEDGGAPGCDCSGADLVDAWRVSRSIERSD